MIAGHCKIFRDEEAEVIHPIAAGRNVTIYHLTLAKRPLIEGRATIIAPVMRAAHLYKVRFDGERRSFVRFVHPGGWQTHPDEMMEALYGHWRATITPDILLNMEGHGP